MGVCKILQFPAFFCKSLRCPAVFSKDVSFPYHWSENHYTHNFYCWGINFAITHTHQLHNFNCRGINLCNACVSLVSVCLASIISQKGNYTTIMVGELILQLHAHQLHINNCWGINCVIIPAPMVCCNSPVLPFLVLFWVSFPKVETFRGATDPFQPDLPLWPRPPPNTSPET